MPRDSGSEIALSKTSAALRGDTRVGVERDAAGLHAAAPSLAFLLEAAGRSKGPPKHWSSLLSPSSVSFTSLRSAVESYGSLDASVAAAAALVLNVESARNETKNDRKGALA